MSKIIHIVNHLPSTVTTRKAIRLINDSVSFSDNENVVFDFKGIAFISRAFADEFIHFVHKHKIKARFTNTNPNIREMLQVVEKNRSGRNNGYHNIAVTPLPEKEQLNQLLSLF